MEPFFGLLHSNSWLEFYCFHIKRLSPTETPHSNEWWRSSSSLLVSSIGRVAACQLLWKFFLPTHSTQRCALSSNAVLFFQSFTPSYVFSVSSVCLFVLCGKTCFVKRRYTRLSLTAQLKQKGLKIRRSKRWEKPESPSTNVENDRLFR